MEINCVLQALDFYNVAFMIATVVGKGKPQKPWSN